MAHQRGEHVINNNVLRIYKDIVEEFVEKLWPNDSLQNMISSRRLSPTSMVLQNINNPFDPRIKSLIETGMVVHLTGPHEDKNAIPYGDDVRALRNAIKNYMMVYYSFLLSRTDDNQHNVEIGRRNANDEVKRMVLRENFVDKEIFTLWKAKHPKDVAKFDEAKRSVVSMIQRLTDNTRVDLTDNLEIVLVWVKELKEAHSKLRQ